MDDEKSKKKRNKKKKNNNKQNKALDEVSEDQNQASTEVKDFEYHGKDSNVCLTGNGSNGTDSTILVECEKQRWLQKEAILEETIRQLLIEKNSLTQKEATLVDTVNQLQNENNLHLQKEFTLEEVIKHLQDENNSYIQKQDNLENKIVQLQREKDSWVQKEFRERISQLVDQKITWDLKEDSNGVIIANMTDDISGLRVQVVELEESRNNLLHANRQLMDNISSLQLQFKDIQNIASTQSSDELRKLATERCEFKSQVEAAFTLVERLMEENAELVEKVSELLIQLDRHDGSDGQRSTIAPKPVVGPAEPASLSYPGSETDENMPKIGQDMNSIDVVEPLKEERNGTDDVLPESSKSKESGEIIPIPIDENSVLDLGLHVAENNEKDATPFSDAPLIGAPFRLVSFVSRYVSGADLVNKNALQV